MDFLLCFNPLFLAVVDLARFTVAISINNDVVDHVRLDLENGLKVAIGGAGAGPWLPLEGATLLGLPPF